MELQSVTYSQGLPDGISAPMGPVPCMYESTGSETRFINLRDPEPRSRRVFAFHRPETLRAWIQDLVEHPDSGTLRTRLRQRYEVRCAREGAIPDIAEALGGPHRVSHDVDHARRLLELVQRFPTATWGRDELRTGEMVNSNSLTSWLLACSGHQMDAIGCPGHGRAPGWVAGLTLAARERFPGRAPEELELLAQ